MRIYCNCNCTVLVLVVFAISVMLGKRVVSTYVFVHVHPEKVVCFSLLYSFAPWERVDVCLW